MSDNISYNEQTFELIKHINENGQELIEDYDKLTEEQKRLAILQFF